jgi:hypothetical protein
METAPVYLAEILNGTREAGCLLHSNHGLRWTGQQGVPDSERLVTFMILRSQSIPDIEVKYGKQRFMQVERENVRISEGLRQNSAFGRRTSTSTWILSMKLRIELT